MRNEPLVPTEVEALPAFRRHFTAEERARLTWILVEIDDEYRPGFAFRSQRLVACLDGKRVRGYKRRAGDPRKIFSATWLTEGDEITNFFTCARSESR